jgi:hypothetical protein
MRIDTFKLKVKVLLLLNRLAYGCRMYERRPRKPEARCYTCAQRGGYFLCMRSKKLSK